MQIGRRKRLIVLGLIGLSACLILFSESFRRGWTVLQRSLAENEEFAGKYQALRLGMQRHTVSDLMGSPPVREYRYNTFTILYFPLVPSILRGGSEAEDSAHTLGEAIVDLTDLPDLYGYLQLAFDSHGRLCAYALIGESLVVESVSGPVKGDHLSALGDLEPWKEGALQE